MPAENENRMAETTIHALFGVSDFVPKKPGFRSATE